MATGSILQSSPKTVKPMLARLARHPFDSPDYLFELKWDGIRALAFIDGNELKLLSRTSTDITAHFPELAGLPKQIHAENAVLDGELVCMDEFGRPSFSRLQRRLQKASNRGLRSNPVHFIAFDLLYLNGQSIMGEPLFSRKDRLHAVLESNEITQACEFIENNGEAFFQATCELGLEGIVAKEKSSLYFPGKRSQFWLKVKRLRESEFVIGGYTLGGKKREPFSSVLLGLYNNDKQLVFVGQVATNLSKPATEELYVTLNEIHASESPFETAPGIQKLLYWCRPELVCQVEYGEFTEDGKLVYPVFKAFREDKSPQECMIADALGWPNLLADFA